MERSRVSDMLFLLSSSMLACTQAVPDIPDFTGGGTSNDDDSTSGDGPRTTSLLTASTSGITTASSTSPPDSTTGGDPPGTSDTGIDPSIGSDSSTSSPPDSTGTTVGLSGGTGAGTTGTPGTTTTTTGFGGTTGGITGDLPCAPYAYAYAYCYYPDMPIYGYNYGLYFCQLYAGDCYGVSGECDALFDEWIACVSALDCLDFELPPCPTELDTLQMTCACGS